MRATYKRITEDLNGAIDDMGKMIELNPKYKSAYYFRGYCYVQQKKYQLAEIEDFNKAIELKTDYASTYTMKGFCEYQLGQKENACEDFNKGKDLGDSSANNYIAKYCK